MFLYLRIHSLKKLIKSKIVISDWMRLSIPTHAVMAMFGTNVASVHSIQIPLLLILSSGQFIQLLWSTIGSSPGGHSSQLPWLFMNSLSWHTANKWYRIYFIKILLEILLWNMGNEAQRVCQLCPFQFWTKFSHKSVNIGSRKFSLWP